MICSETFKGCKRFGTWNVFIDFCKNSNKNQNNRSSWSDLQLVVMWSEIHLPLSLHGSLHLLHHPQWNRERLQLIHPDVWTVPACTRNTAVNGTKNTCTGSCNWDRWADDIFTCTHRCETNPGCPLLSVGRPEHTYTSVLHSNAVVCVVFLARKQLKQHPWACWRTVVLQYVWCKGKLMGTMSLHPVHYKHLVHSKDFRLLDNELKDITSQWVWVLFSYHLPSCRSHVMSLCQPLLILCIGCILTHTHTRYLQCSPYTGPDTPTVLMCH